MSALIRNVKTGRELKCHIEHLHPIGEIVPWDDGNEEEEEREFTANDGGPWFGEVEDCKRR